MSATHADAKKRRVVEGAIRIEAKETTLDTVIEEHDVIVTRLHRHEPPVPDTPVVVLSVEEGFVVVDKPAGVPVHPTGRYNKNTVVSILETEQGLRRLKPLYRLDKNTSGVLLFADNPATARSFQAALARRDSAIGKVYLARVVGRFPERLEVDRPIALVRFGTEAQNSCRDDGVPARSSFERVLYDEASDTSVVRCVPHTGRTHQLRLHLQSCGHPICNDASYLLHQIHKPRTPDGDVARETALRQTHGWDFDPHCPDCLDPKGDPLDHSIWLHAVEYRYGTHVWSTPPPPFSLPDFPVRQHLETFSQLHGTPPP